ncbi:DoxX family protein, partial [Candidatus Parcubacteria bacterium]
MPSHRIFDDPPFAKFLFGSTGSSWFWLIVRLYLGWAWLEAGWQKVQSSAWTGEGAGTAVRGFVGGALAKVGGPHPDVQEWYAWFLEHAVLPNAAAWSHAIAWGEILVGVGLAAGAFTGIAAFFGIFMNLNFLLAGTVSTNPVLFALGAGVMLAWKVAGYRGLDRYLLPR